MKILLILAFAIGLANTFGQTPINKANEIVVKPLQNGTSVFAGVIVGLGTRAQRTAYFLNDQKIEYTLLVSINPDLMKSLILIDKPIEIDSIKYERQIRLISKNNYFPRAISLINLKNKYFKKYFPEGLKNVPVIFMIDNNIVHGDYNKYEIDENNLYAITMDSQNEKDKIKLDFLKLTTKSEASIKNFKSGYIWMTGAGVTLTK